MDFCPVIRDWKRVWHQGSTGWCGTSEMYHFTHRAYSDSLLQLYETNGNKLARNHSSASGKKHVALIVSSSPDTSLALIAIKHVGS